jgi:RNA polymerase sigma-70 factor
MHTDQARELYDRGRKRWPELPLSFDDFVAQVRQHLSKLAGVDKSEIAADDLFLVAACLRRLPGAVDRFDAYAWPQVEPVLRKKGAEPERLAEIRQVLLVRLFIADDPEQPPRIAEYTGRVELHFWLWLIASRLLLDARRAEARLTGLSDSFADRAAASDVEMSFIRGCYEADFAAALREAMSTLGNDDRILLKLRYREELTSDQIGAMLGVSRVTAHRRVVAARDALAAKLRAGLKSRLSLSETGLESLMSLLSSRLVPALTAEIRQELSGAS